MIFATQTVLRFLPTNAHLGIRATFNCSSIPRRFGTLTRVAHVAAPRRGLRSYVQQVASLPETLSPVWQHYLQHDVLCRPRSCHTNRYIRKMRSTALWDGLKPSHEQTREAMHRHMDRPIFEGPAKKQGTCLRISSGEQRHTKFYSKLEPSSCVCTCILLIQAWRV